MPEQIYFPVKGDAVHLADGRVGTVVNDAADQPELVADYMWLVRVAMKTVEKPQVQVSYNRSVGAWEEIL